MTEEEKRTLGYKAGQLYLKVLGLLIEVESCEMSQKIVDLIDQIAKFSPICYEANSALCLFAGRGVTEKRLLEYIAAVVKAEDFFGAFDMKDYVE